MPSENLTATLSLAAELGAALTSATSFRELTTLLRRHLKWLVPATDHALCILDRDERLDYRRLRCDSDERVVLGSDLVSWCLRHETGVGLPDIVDGTSYPPEVPPGVYEWSAGSMEILPLLGANQMIGALVLYAPQPGAFASVDRGLIHLMVHNVAGALRVAMLVDELDGAEEVIHGMAHALEARDAYTAGHSERVTQYALALATQANLPFSLRQIIAHAGPLHDVGKIGVPDTVLLKTAHLTDEEFAIIQRHPTIGDDIIAPLRSLQRMRAGVRNHHERYDGLGYPDRLAGENIPLEARVLAIADTYDAMTSSRPYRTGMPIAKALRILSENEGPQWDPLLIRIFIALYAESKGQKAA